MPVDLDLHIPRHAFSVRERARAGDVWRAFQEAAVLGSSAVGWPPHRYRRERCAFVVRRMTVVHHREAAYGDPVHARTWVRDFRRGLLTTREIRLTSGAEPLAAATQEWVHVSFDLRDGEVVLKPARAARELLDAFPEEDLDPAPRLPSVQEPLEGPRQARAIPLRLTEMDPLGHVNHPAYVDLVDEHTSHLLLEAGVDPVALRPVADEVVFRAGLSAPEPAHVETWRVGRAGAAVVLAHRILRPDGTLAAEATTVRTLEGADPDRLSQALEAP
jgi:acyl-CoA thioesterase FadM